MNLNLLRVATAVPKVQVAHVPYNRENISQLMSSAAQKGAKIVAFPELCLTAYTCGDLFFQQTLLDTAQSELSILIEETKSLPLIGVVGLPLRFQNKCYNCAVVFQKGKILGVVPKTYLPNYAEFYERRWFASGAEIEYTTLSLCGQSVSFGTKILFSVGKATFGVEICEDLWAPNPPSIDSSLAGAVLTVNTSASNETIGKTRFRTNLITAQSARTMSGYLYVSSGIGESTSDLVFSGHSLIVENGKIIAQNQLYEEESLVIADLDIDLIQHERQKYLHQTPNYLNYTVIPCEETSSPTAGLFRPVSRTPFVPKNDEKLHVRCEEIFLLQAHGLAKRMKHTGAKTAVIGISGGLDSTLALLVTCKAFEILKKDMSNIIAITMPGFGTTDRTYQNALQLMQKLSVTSKEISIVPACLQHMKDIDHAPERHDVVYQNIQARERTQILMDVANQTGGLVIGTGDLSELALGWATYNGDHMSMYAVNAGVPKTLVQFLVRYVSNTVAFSHVHDILRDVLDTPISPELLPADAAGNIAQKTEDEVGPYLLHDFFLYHLIRHGASPTKIFFYACEAFKGEFTSEVILNWLRIFYRRFFSQQFKRNCLPDGPKIGSINLSPRGDWRMPSDACAAVWLNELDQIKP